MSLYTRKAHRRVPVPGMSLAAMVDVVFLLLLFFICTNDWGRPEGALPADLPTGAGQGLPLPDERRDLPVIRIQITGAGDDVQIRCEERPISGFDGLAQTLSRLAAADKGVPVVIDAAGAVSFRWVIRALNASLKAGLENVAFTAPSRKRTA